MFELTKAGVLAGASLVALMAGAEARAQAVAAAAPPVESAASSESPNAGRDVAGSDIVVTGSRLFNGYKTPTPVIAAAAEELKQTSPNLLSEALGQLPVFRNSSRSQTAGNSSSRDNGVSLLNLRGIGAQRTLILLNGRRLVSSNTSGAIDINTLPQDVLKRVEIVTGGASAAYGSDAVAGVVNFILDDEFQGVRASAQAGVSKYGDGATRGAALTAGSGFGGGNGHIIASGEYFKQDRIPFYNGRDWAEAGYAIVPITGTGPTRLVAAPYVFSNSAPGGLITTGPLANTQFLPGGVPAPFVGGLYRNATNMVGGDGVLIPTDLTAGVERWSTFARIDYDFGNIKPFIEAGLAQSITRANIQKTSVFGTAAFTIFRDNAFLPASIRAALPAGPTGDSFRLGRINLDFPDAQLFTRSRTLRVVTGFDWSLGDDWDVKAYYSFGQNKYRTNTLDTPLYRQTYAAADAVVNPANGQIVCRSTLSGFDPGCVPINLFGSGAPSQAAIDYVLGNTQSDLTLRQHVASATIGGSPFNFGGNAVNVAVGVEYRRETARQTADAASLLVNNATGLRGFPAGFVGTVGGSPLGNYFQLDARYSVREAFAEVEVPLLKDLPFANELIVNGAVRLIDYSTVGGVTTWKGGFSYKPFEDLRFRATRSRDIRAGNIAELFTPQFVTRPTVLINGSSTSVNQIRSGDPSLRPEKADTFTAGVIYTPSWLRGFNMSLDVFDIKIKDAVQQLSAQQTFDQCAAGSVVTCAQISTANGLTSVRTPFLNLASLRTRGVDLDLSYRAALGAGQFSIRGIFTYLDELSTRLPGVAKVDRAGDIGITGTPRFSGNLVVGYDVSNVSLLLQERYIGPGKLDNTFLPGMIADNHISAVFYTDVTARVRTGPKKDLELFLTVNNLFDKDPPIAPSIPVGLYRATNFSLYDAFGRYITVGAKVIF
jgi:iron complex outermembrane receptor protein